MSAASDSPKRTCRVPVNLTEREFNDLALLAVADNRTVSDMLYVIARRYMYGRVGAQARQGQQSRSASEDRDGWSDTEFNAQRG